MGLLALFTDKLRTLSAKGSGHAPRAELTFGLHFSLHLLQFSMDLFHSVDKEGGLQLVRVALR
ncbi:MAG: hypothetical protein MJE68_10860 [Proteobacteria bacterium]|nr:hypothetical protein [Pseudomonadota bacterium]